MPEKFINCAQKIENLRKPVKASTLTMPAPGIIRAAMAGKTDLATALIAKPLRGFVDEDVFVQAADIGENLGKEILAQS